MSRPFSLALGIQLRDIAQLVREEENLQWAELRSPRNQPEGLLQTLRRRQEARKATTAEEDMGGKSPLARFGVDIEAVDNDGKTALHRSAMFSDTDKVAWLLDEGLSLEAQDNQGDTPLHYAVFYTQRAVVLLLLSRGAHVAAKNKEGWTPLHVAAGHSSTQAHAIIGDLANSGADLEATDREGRTPLLFALEGNRKDAIDALLRAGARADARDGKGHGALHLAVGCSSKMVEKFLGLGAPIEAADKRGRTPLHYSAAKGVKATTLVLLKAGARPDRADNLGKTALDIAQEEGNGKLMDLLLEWAPARAPTPEPEAHPIEPDAGSDGEESPVRTAACPHLQAASPVDPSTPAMATRGVEGASPALEAAYERSIGRAQRTQMESLQRQLKELETVVSDRDSLQRQLAAQSAAHEAETRQLHADKTGLQVALQAAEEGSAALQARVSDASRRLAGLAELRAENAVLHRRVEELGRDREARQALEAKIGKQQEELSSFARRLAELKEQLWDARAEQKADAAAYVSTLESQQVRLNALQEANDALTADAAQVPDRAGEPSMLGRSIQEAMAMLQDSPILRERSRNITNVKRPAFAGSKLAAEVGRPQAGSESAPPKHKTPVKAVVKRIGGGYSMKPAAGCPKMSPLGAKHAQPDLRPHGRAPAQQRLDSGVPRSPVDRAGARVAASSAGAGNADSLDATLSEGGEHAQAPAKSPQTLKSPGAPKPAGEEAGGKPPHSFLPNLQPGRVSPAARREQVLAGPLTRASTPQSRSQVMKENAKSGAAAVPASEKTPEGPDKGAGKVSALVLSARRLAARSRSPNVATKASKSLTESFS